MILRADGYATYNFAVVDDMDMRITDVVRGDARQQHRARSTSIARWARRCPTSRTCR